MDAVTQRLKADQTLDLTPIDTSTTLVPLKPTLRMLTEGARAGDVPVEIVYKIYAAILKAAD